MHGRLNARSSFTTILDVRFSMIKARLNTQGSSITTLDLRLFMEHRFHIEICSGDRGLFAYSARATVGNNDWATTMSSLRLEDV